jgi:hypothetical protein
MLKTSGIKTEDVTRGWRKLHSEELNKGTSQKKLLDCQMKDYDLGGGEEYITMPNVYENLVGMSDRK